MDLTHMRDSLHPLERTVLPLLADDTLLSDLVSSSGLQQVEVMRALQWLENKGLVTLKQETRAQIELDENGRHYAANELPERTVLRSISEGHGTIASIAGHTGLSRQEIGAAIGILKAKGAISTGEEFSLTNDGNSLLGKSTPEEELLGRLATSPVYEAQLQEQEREACDALRRRKKLVKVEHRTVWHAHLTSTGEELLKEDISGEGLVEHVTPQMLKDGSWRDKTFRRYDVSSSVPRIHGGKRHFMKDAIAHAKRIWLDMGFQEITGPFVQSSFWVFDALYTAQDHPVREMQDTFFVHDPAQARLPSQQIVDDVKQAHEEGVAGSTGWQMQWDPEKARTNVMRTHTTALSAKKLTEMRSQGIKKGKYFALGGCFRNEALDWSHLFEFNQTEGIVVDPDANFTHLLGYLRQFFSKMGFPHARFRPAYFPYTEPSVEIDVYHPVHGEWMELGGAGMFRPEVVVPLLGEDVPVLAWGPGFDRVILEYFDIHDIRDLYRNDIAQLRGMKAWLRE